MKKSLHKLHFIYINLYNVVFKNYLKTCSLNNIYVMGLSKFRKETRSNDLRKCEKILNNNLIKRRTMWWQAKMVWEKSESGECTRRSKASTKLISGLLEDNIIQLFVSYLYLANQNFTRLLILHIVSCVISLFNFLKISCKSFNRFTSYAAIQYISSNL